MSSKHTHSAETSAHEGARRPRHAASDNAEAIHDPAGHGGEAPIKPEPRPGRMAYIPALDGIRTLAVAAVVLYHLSPNLAPGGM